MNAWRWNLLVSLAVHAAALGIIVSVADSPQPTRKEMVIPIMFEIVEGAAGEASEKAAEANSENTKPIEKPKAVKKPKQVEKPKAAEATKAINLPTTEKPSNVPKPTNVPKAEEAANMPKAEEPAKEQEAKTEATAATEKTVETKVSKEAESRQAITRETAAAVLAEPKALNRITPAYPRVARRKGHEGSVTVEISVTAEGGVAEAKVLESSSHAELDAAALAAVREARFAPATEGGRNVDGKVRLTMNFRLR